MRRQAKKFAKGSLSDGSALILTMVLTSLLAIVGVLFLMMARVNKITASSISKNKELDSAVETVIAKISEELVLDVPGVAGAEYYDYPGPEDKWLASLEPYQDGSNYKWRHVSDVYNRFDSNVGLQAVIVPDYQEPTQVGDSNNTITYRADADGDGVADSKWVKLDAITSSGGKPVYAAIRIVDNGGMLNVNTAYKFDPTGSREEVDGSSQLQINLLALASRPYDVLTPVQIQERIDNLLKARSPVNPSDLSGYEQDVIWRYGPSYGPNTPFDISDELELRYRYLINQDAIDTRSEVLPSWELRTVGNLRRPADSTQLNKWFINASPDTIFDANYAYRHIATTYNMDRIIDPNGTKMANVNTESDPNKLYTRIRQAILDANPYYPSPDVEEAAAQIAVNLIDYRDSDPNVTYFDLGTKRYYGFEQPCVYISELACRLKRDTDNPNIYYRSYAVELYKPYSGDDNPDPNWRLFISNPTDPNIEAQINWSSGTSPYYVIRWQDLTDPCVPLDVNATLPIQQIQQIDNPDTASFVVFAAGSVISLIREVNDVNVVVDSNVVPVAVPGGWLATDGNPHSVQRDITRHKCILRLWNVIDPNTLGADNFYVSSNPNIIQAHPADSNFTNVGEIGMVFRKPAYYEFGASVPSGSVIGYGGSDTEDDVRLNLADPNFQQVFNYLTVFDPNAPRYGGHPETEKRVKGRININTAPWYVLAQLPWVSQRKDGYNDANLAQAIAAYRDKLNLSLTGGPDYYHSGASNSRELETGINGLREEPGFESIGELAAVINKASTDDPFISPQINYDMRYYTLGSQRNVDLAGFPDLTTLPTGGDGVADDFEERDLIFARISDLVTVRSDVFTAYILVRIGADGPQKRVIAIFDRSNVRSPDDGKMRVLAVQPVADPR